MKPRDIFEHLRDLVGGFLHASAFDRIEMDVRERKSLLGLLRLALLRASRLDDAMGLLAGRFDIE
jgi:hypothetical protein